MNTPLISQAKLVYNVANWSDGYFDINEQGDLVAQPKGQPQTQVSLSKIIQALKEAGLRLPVLLRFTDILRDRVLSLSTAFNDAISQYEYKGSYTPVYPIKVNQQFSVVEQLLKAKPQIGLEAGSKPELLAILGATDKPLKIVCNGYKDSEFLELATIATQMGHQVYVVVEKLSELKTLIKISNLYNAAPAVGIRIRLNSVGKGKWQNSGGEKGKFGLTSSQLLTAIDLLKTEQKLDLFQLIHFHIGSQIANIRDIQIAIKECARYYTELKQLGINITTLDVGGGLGVDYEGSGSRSQCSMNYDMKEYARNIVSGVSEVCRAANIEEPNIITESGRAMTAHHAVLITNVIDIETPSKPLENLNFSTSLDQNAPLESHEMAAINQQISERTALECYHDAIHYFSEAQQKFVLGLISLQQWAELEALYFATLHHIRQHLTSNARAHREIKEELDEKLASKLFCNFSLFQSLPDAWGIDQIFPVVPLQNLNQPLNMRAIIQDITCDSDGQLKQYADGMGIESSLPLPQYQAGEEYLLGMFMVGAYQEILGDMHNLFGDTDSAHIEFDAQGNWRINHTLQGDTAESALATVHFQKETLLENYQTQLQNSGLTNELKDKYYLQLKTGLEGYTYFED
ncbi:biosynthetic arginine decarboxylase [Catenovulum sp. 2E275]|uniref:biosynthetic arginine decarboxylase n=1 Tax=Catenovulum sp. 2E275 TaxID=2980497 RepID=UPI0021D2A0D1|nr:biosynthetic arginine decarboxylase [Catenovulum sp. 2E275]MCU4675895.1 biosynthetic arginine decarboxylase [Catenovulum sp. 2E275]